MDQKSLEILEFNKVRTRLAALSSFSAGHELALQLVPTTDLFLARRWQQETAEMLQLLDGGSDVTIGGARDVRPVVDRSTRGFTLLGEDFMDLRNTLIAARTLRRKLEKVAERYPALAAIAELIEDVPGLVDAINRTLDERGEVLDSASEKLARVRSSLRVTHGRIQEKLRGILNSHATYLQEPLISTRNGRYVLPVRSESRSNVKGIVHDQSGSGATVWVEPMATVELNNEYRQLQIEEDKEVQRILAALSGLVADQSDIIVRVVDRLAELDLIFAKARYASETNAIAPEFIDWRRPKKGELHPGSMIWIRGARHPLLDPAEVIPTDLLVPEDVFLVLITGPNTGGKTVSLKTLGLMVLMAQAGMHVPAREARLTLFDDVFADIGDEQSIEQSLSTFSGHMTNINRILDAVDERSLVLLDELGSGTDPAEGAALAQSIISFLRDKGATTFTATHYPELKLYATQTAGATNASLLFDLETLSPTYEMTIGLPGKSNALAIARRLGVNEAVLDQALQLIGVGNNKAEVLLDSIYDLREKIASEEAATRLTLKRTQREYDEVQDRLAQIEIEREEILQETRAQVEAELETLRNELKQVRRKMRDAESRTQLKKLSQSVDEIEERPLSSLTPTPLIDTVLSKKKKSQPKLQVGDIVFIKTINTRGEVIGLSKKEAEVAVGRLHMKAQLDEIDFVERPQVEEESQSFSGPATKSPGIELDIRGKRVDEGLLLLEQHLDSAVLARLPWIRIIHGKGTGRLREAVRQALRQNRDVLRWEEGDARAGGAGVTIARLEEMEE